MMQLTEDEAERMAAVDRQQARGERVDHAEMAWYLVMMDRLAEIACPSPSA